MWGGASPSPTLPSALPQHLVDAVEEAPVVIRELARQVLGAHQVQPLGRAHSGTQLIGVWSLWVEECSVGCLGSPGGMVGGESLGPKVCAQGRRNVRRAGVLQEVEGLPKEACPDSSPVLGPLSHLRAPNSSPLRTSSIG